MTIRENLFAHPGVSGNEHYAHDVIVSRLKELHPNKLYDHVGGYGVVAFWGDGPSAPTLAFRADIDALPIGHRCGHDGHTAILLHFAELMSRQKNVLLIFQPEEETGRGSQKILDSGILQQYNIRAIFGLHNLPGYPLGRVVLCRRTFAAASSGVIYHFEGRNTHASTPEKGLNPGIAVSETIQSLNRTNHWQGAVDDFRQTTLICVSLGEPAFGTSAGAADVMFTLRAFTNNAMERLLGETHDTVSKIAERHRLQLQISLQEPFRATENTSLVVERVEEILLNHGVEVDYEIFPFRWSEDFSNYLMHYPGCFFGVGAGENHVELHHPGYVFPDALIPCAAEVFNLINNDFQI